MTERDVGRAPPDAVSVAPANERDEREGGEGRELAGIFVALVLLRLPWLCALEQDVDGARFVGAVLRFDVTRMHPHPPGYPVYVGPAIALQRAWGLTPAIALSVISAAGAALAGCALYALARRSGRSRAYGVLWAALATLPPGPALLATRQGSDALGLGLCLTAYAMVARPGSSGAFGALACAGLLAGARHSLAALVLPSVLLAAVSLGRERAVTRGILVFVGSISSWLLPLLAWQGPVAWWSAVRAHALGHFTEYGGSVATDPDAIARLSAFAQGLVGYGWGAGRWTASTVAGPLALLAGVLGVGALRGAKVPSAMRALMIGAGLYALWVLFAQNVRWAPRHVVALWPVLAWWVTEGVARLGRSRRSRRVLGSALVLSSLVAGVEAVRVQRAQTPAAVCLSDALARVARPGRDLAASAQLAHWIRFRQPDRRVLWAATAAQAERLARDNGWGLLISSETPGALEFVGLGRGELVATCAADPRVHPALSSVGWVRVNSLSQARSLGR